MMELSRKVDKRIVIDEVITVVVLEIHGDKVRLGVEAPKEVPIVRDIRSFLPPFDSAAGNLQI
jgi:carbon storage regulator